MIEYEVIVKQYANNHAWGLDLRTTTQAFSVDAVLMLVKPYCRVGFCAIVRPTKLAPGEELHEWRSFDGQPLARVTF